MRAREVRLLLVRHAETDWNRDALIQGQRDDARLTREGAVESGLLADRLESIGVTSLVSSDLARAMATAAPVATRLNLALITDARLRERSLGALEGQGAASLTSELSGIRNGQVVDADAAPPAGESLRSLYARVAAFLSELRTHVSLEPSPQTVAIVAHGGSLKVARAWLEGTPVEQMAWPALGNCEVWDLSFSPIVTLATGASA